MVIPKIAPYDINLGPKATPRVNWRLSPGRSALLVHDMQDYFLNFYDPSSEPFGQLIQRTQQLITLCRQQGILVVYTAQPSAQSASERGLLQDFWGSGLVGQPDQANIYGPLAPEPGDVVLTKWRYSAFKRSSLREQLYGLGIDELMICGVYAHIGCLQTAAEAFMVDIKPFLVGDAIADFSAEQHQMALDYVAGCCGMVVSFHDVLAQLMPSLDLSGSESPREAAL